MSKWSARYSGRGEEGTSAPPAAFRAFLIGFKINMLFHVFQFHRFRLI